MSTHSGNVAPSKPSSSTGKSHVRSSSPIYELSEDSSPTVRESLWCSGDFMLGAGMVIFQRTTWKIVICYDTQKHFHFLPRGRKDLGETIDRTALREGWEESGYNPKHLPLFKCTAQPSPPNSRLRNYPDTEPIMISVTPWSPRWVDEFVEVETAPTSKTHSRRDTAGPAATEEAQKRSVPRSTWAVDPATTKLKQYVKRKRLVDPGGEYLTHWYAGIIEEDAVRQEGTMMPDEVAYTSVLLTFDEVEAIAKTGSLTSSEFRVVQYAIKLLSLNYEYIMRQDEIQRKRDTAVKAAQLQSRATPRPQFQPVVNPESSRSSRRVASSAPSSQIPEAAGVRRGDSEGIINEEANGEANGEEPYYPNDDADGALEALVRAKDVDVKGKGKGEPKTSM